MTSIWLLKAIPSPNDVVSKTQIWFTSRLHNSPPWIKLPPQSDSSLILHISQKLHKPIMSRQVLNLPTWTTLVRASEWFSSVWILIIFITLFDTSFLIKWSLISIFLVFSRYAVFLHKCIAFELSYKTSTDLWFNPNLVINPLSQNAYFTASIMVVYSVLVVKNATTWIHNQ